MEKETKIILQFIVTKDIFEIKKDRKKSDTVLPQPCLACLFPGKVKTQ